LANLSKGSDAKLKGLKRVLYGCQLQSVVFLHWGEYWFLTAGKGKTAVFYWNRILGKPVERQRRKAKGPKESFHGCQLQSVVFLHWGEYWFLTAGKREDGCFFIGIEYWANLSKGSDAKLKGLKRVLHGCQLHHKCS